MTIKECFKFGRVAKQIGNNNELLLALEVEDPRNYKNIKFVFVELNQSLVPFFITKLQVRPSAIVVALEDVVTQNEQKELLKKDVYLPLNLLAPEESESVQQLVGYAVIDETHGAIGEVEALLEFKHQSTFQIQKDGTEILIPAVEEFIISIDHTTKTIHLDAPEGLIDIYLEE